MRPFPMLLLLLLTLTTFGQQPTLDPKGLDTYINEMLQRYDAPGLAVAVIRNDTVIYSKGFGYRNLEQQLPVTQETVFHIASMSKAFTATLLGILEGEDRLSLKNRPALYVPNFEFHTEKMNNLITVEDLLSHKSGLGNHGLSIVLFPEADKLKTVQRLRHLKPQDEIKNSWNYSNIGYTLAGTLVEQVTGTTWDAYLQKKLFSPLRMKASFTTVDAMKAYGNYAQGYGRHQSQTVPRPYENYYSYTPAGAIKSSVQDLTHWMRVWLNKGVFEGTPVIPEDYVRRATSLQNTKYHEVYEPDSFLQGEGFGWRLRAWSGKYRVRHGGNTNGFSTVMDLFPFEKIGIVVLANQQSSILPYVISDHISRKLYGLPSIDYPIQVGDVYKAEVADVPMNKKQPPTHALAEFVGTYNAKGYGKIQVIEKAGKLRAKLPTYTFRLAHLHYNTFYLQGNPDFDESFNPEFTVKFVDDIEGMPSALHIVGAQKEDVVFHKENPKQ